MSTNQESAFSMEPWDRFRCIIVSDGVKYDQDPDAETVITFFVIRRVSCLFDIINVVKTFKNNECISRNVQQKVGIMANRIDREVTDLTEVFSEGIKKATGLTLKWHILNLLDAKDMKEQVKRIKAWGRVGVSTFADIPPMVSN